MATQTVKTTYSLDVKTVRALEALAQRWRVSKSEALRRAIQASAEREPREAGRDALRALDELQQALGLTAEQADRWVRAVRDERRAWTRRVEPRRR
jgi:Arc/MetJ-type ribon-helix-helix transcriptional regulator